MAVGTERILMTGGSGRLGTELRALLPGVTAPGPEELDVTRPGAAVPWLDRLRPRVLVHAAAYTDVAAAERERAACWAVNVEGTRHLVEAAGGRDLRFIFISTDYVFDGTRGGYREDDTPGPVRNYYALTKLVAESLARLAPNPLVIRTSFRPRTWPHPVAFEDLFTSQDYVDLIAPDIATAIRRCREIPDHTLHIATERKSVYELARRRAPAVRRGSRREAAVALPEDISLDVSRWRELTRRWGAP